MANIQWSGKWLFVPLPPCQFDDWMHVAPYLQKLAAGFSFLKISATIYDRIIIETFRGK
jgi:hypothetical protein